MGRGRCRGWGRLPGGWAGSGGWGGGGAFAASSVWLAAFVGGWVAAFGGGARRLGRELWFRAPFALRFPFRCGSGLIGLSASASSRGIGGRYWPWGCLFGRWAGLCPSSLMRWMGVFPLRRWGGVPSLFRAGGVGPIFMLPDLGVAAPRLLRIRRFHLHAIGHLGRGVLPRAHFGGAVLDFLRRCPLSAEIFLVVDGLPAARRRAAFLRAWPRRFAFCRLPLVSGGWSGASPVLARLDPLRAICPCGDSIALCAPDGSRLLSMAPTLACRRVSLCQWHLFRRVIGIQSVALSINRVPFLNVCGRHLNAHP